MQCLNKKGNISVLLTLSFTALLGFVALTIDVGNAIIHKQKLQVAADAGALAGMQKIFEGDVAMESEARYVAILNGAPEDKLVITANSKLKKIHVEVEDITSSLFAQVLGKDSFDVGVDTLAVIRPLSKSSAVPLSIQKPSECPNFEVGKSYSLHSGNDTGNEKKGNSEEPIDPCIRPIDSNNGSSGGYIGNWGSLDIDNLGNSNALYENTLKYGSLKDVEVGKTYYTIPGNRKSATISGINYRIQQDDGKPECDSNISGFVLENVKSYCQRVVIVPVVRSFEEAGVQGTSPIEVIGFAPFYIESVDSSGEVKAKFIKLVKNGTPSIDMDDTTDFGSYAVRLLHEKEMN